MGQPQAGPGPRNPVILIVDDSSLSRRILRRYLEAAGFSVEEAADGPSAIERFSLGGVDLVVLDLVMREMGGLQVLQVLKEMNPRVKVIIATADVQAETRTESLEAGAITVLNKPFDAALVVSCVTQAMRDDLT